MYHVLPFICMHQSSLRGLENSSSFSFPKAATLGEAGSEPPALVLHDPGLDTRGQAHGAPWAVARRVSTLASPAGEGRGGVSSVSELPSLLAPCGGPGRVEHPLCGLLSG